MVEIPENTGVSEGRLSENGQRLLSQLKGCDELRHKIATRLIDLGIDTSVNKKWPEILEALRTWLTGRFEVSRDYCEQHGIRQPEKGEGLCGLLFASGQLYDHLRWLAQEGVLGTEGIMRPLKMFAALGNYWRNRLERGLENRADPEKGYDLLSKGSMAKVNSEFEEVIGLPFELIEALLKRSI